MRSPSPILEALADAYEASQAGQTGLGTVDIQPRLEVLLQRAGCIEGDARELAERQLRAAAREGLITLEPRHTRDPRSIYKVRLSPANEARFFACIDRPSPTAIRRQWSELFAEAMGYAVPREFTSAWPAFCQQASSDALHWRNLREFRRADLEGGRELLSIIAKLLNQCGGEDYVRVASCRICGDSKQLQRQRGTLEKLLARATTGRIKTLGDLGILETPRLVLTAGPLRLRWAEGQIDLGISRAGLGLDQETVERAELECDAVRCVTVENKTAFHDRALKYPRDLHIHTSYPNAATLALLRRLPPTLDFVHLGDSDPAGFDILRELRAATQRPFRSEGMAFHPDLRGPPLTPAEIRLLEQLSSDPSLAPEQPALRALLAAGRKGAFEQENRPARIT